MAETEARRRGRSPPVSATSAAPEDSTCLLDLRDRSPRLGDDPRVEVTGREWAVGAGSLSNRAGRQRLG